MKYAAVHDSCSKFLYQEIFFFFLNPHKRAVTRPYPTSKVFARARDIIFLFRMQCRVKKSPRKNIILRHE